MIALLQRVTEASVMVAGERIAAIERGLLVLVGIERGDGFPEAARLAERLVGYRVFADGDARMNLSVAQIDGGILLVPQFTLAADTDRGRRPGFETAAPADQGEPLFSTFVEQVRALHSQTATGRFGADMRVALVNDGPVTFWLQSSPEST